MILAGIILIALVLIYLILKHHHVKAYTENGLEINPVNEVWLIEYADKMPGKWEKFKCLKCKQKLAERIK